MVQKIHIIGGGTFNHVRNHLAIAAPAFGQTARRLDVLFRTSLIDDENYEVVLHLTKMADHNSKIVTNDDVSALVDDLIKDSETRVIVMNAAISDYTGTITNGWNETDSGSHQPRLKTSEGNQRMLLKPANKIIEKIRKVRKDIFVVGFKTTTSNSSDQQYKTALDMLKRDSLNLVLANDTVTRNNMIVAPEETRYTETTDRDEVLQSLVKITCSRMRNTFTRSTVVEGELINFQNDDRIPDNLRKVVNHFVENGAYYPVRGATAGHFAVRLGPGKCLTSRRKTNYTVKGGLDLVEVEYDGTDKVIAYGAKPSVGGQSQRIIFDSHIDIDCIAHAHIEMKSRPRDPDKIALDMRQWSRECGSFQCGQSVSDLIPKINGVRAVMIENHGPNILFSRHTPASEVIDFIDANFDLYRKTGGDIA